ncbi:uncharacterized protein N7458_000946 [Penicillium daleae]|uniref:Uncharacterized protein n=1 Tax=Penicillium daleae TaxID=63821 RepID=A0AAD6CGX1_9EURO|nr:uncharacterized protein N7458_000946 [Penicillium daleae]KAJ5465260.1 hypothetical protein N7458_000946 [Penicillium daleae]
MLPPESDMEIERTHSDGSGVEEALEPPVETEFGSSGSDSIMGENEQSLPDMEPSVADELEHLEPIREEPSFSANEESEGHAELGFEDEQPRRGSEESIAGRESLEDANMEEHASEQDDGSASRQRLRMARTRFL